MANQKKASPGLAIALDYFPIVLFFAANFLLPGSLVVRIVASSTSFLSDLDRMAAIVIARVIVATVVFIVATAVALVVSQVKLGRISPMLWITAVLVVVFGGLTIYFHDPKFIQMKPTFVYALLAGVLGFGLVTRKPLLELLLQTAYPGLSAEGWRRLTINWTIFFVAMALLNELVWRNTSWDFWVAYKLWGVIPLTLLFAMLNIPMLLKHGLQLDKPEDVPIPPEA